MNVLLRGLVGSHAYGMAHANSDEDRLGIFVAPTLEIAGLNWHDKKATKSRTNPDITMHEVGKFLRLALKGNPTITELLWLPGFEIISDWGQVIVGLRLDLLSHKAIKNSYLGYATSQAKRLERRGDSFSSDTRSRTAKHGKHMLRLLRQARKLALTGQLTVAVDDPWFYDQFNHMSVEQMLRVYEEEIRLTEEAFSHSVLPEEPNRETVEGTLREIRRIHLD